jgi:RNA polymerase subunit RPABC4/transcription elongation factor Spt4
MGKRLCPFCNEIINDNLTVCPVCGERIAEEYCCPHCNEIIPRGSKVCPVCAENIEQTEQNNCSNFKTETNNDSVNKSGQIIVQKITKRKQSKTQNNSYIKETLKFIIAFGVLVCGGMLVLFYKQYNSVYYFEKECSGFEKEVLTDGSGAILKYYCTNKPYTDIHKTILISQSKTPNYEFFVKKDLFAKMEWNYKFNKCDCLYSWIDEPVSCTEKEFVSALRKQFAGYPFNKPLTKINVTKKEVKKDDIKVEKEATKTEQAETIKTGEKTEVVKKETTKTTKTIKKEQTTSGSKSKTSNNSQAKSNNTTQSADTKVSNTNNTPTVQTPTPKAEAPKLKSNLEKSTDYFFD